MDSRWRFLHHMVTELWGRMWRCASREWDPGQAQEPLRRQTPLARQRREAYRREVGKRAGHVPRKAAIVHHMPVP